MANPPDDTSPTQLGNVERADIAHPPDEPPVVARLVIEIRSDGTRTIARGALEDQSTGQRVSMQAEGGSPAELAASMMRSMLKNPLLAFKGRGGVETVKNAVRALLPGRGKR